MRPRALVFVALGAGLVYFLYRGGLVNTVIPNKLLPRGIRNNNPGNVRYTGAQWLGLIGKDDKGFCIFDTPANGLRALAQNCIYIIRTLNKTTYAAFGGTYAPASDHNPENYGADLAGQLGKLPTDLIQYNSLALARLMRAIVWNENGQNPYSDTQYLAGATEGLRAKGLI